MASIGLLIINRLILSQFFPIYKHIFYKAQHTKRPESHVWRFGPQKLLCRCQVLLPQEALRGILQVKGLPNAGADSLELGLEDG